MLDGEYVLCLNEKPTFRKDFYWDILEESIDICSVFTVTLSAECFLLCPSLTHMNDDLCLILQKDFPQVEEMGRKKPLASFFLPAIVCLSCMELICKCKFSSYCFLNYTWLLVIVEIRNGDILIKSQHVEVFIQFHMKKLVFF